MLPFARLGDDAAPAIFADGMVDDIVTGLSRIHGLFVVGRASTARYADGPVDPAQAGRALGVRYLLQGSVRRAAERLRVGVQLADAASGAHAWAERYDREFGDLFALQDEIALSVVGAIAPSLQRAERERVRRRRPDRLDAYALVLRAQADVDSGMPAQVTRALALLERAIALEPGYALAHGYAAMGHHCLFLRAGLQASERDASVHHAREALVHGHDHAAAFTALDAALALSPSSALSYILGSVMAGWQGQAERAIDWSARGLRLSPFDPWAFAAHDAQAMGHFHRGRYEQASQAAYRSVQANPAHSITYVQLAAALAKLGRTAEARAAAARVLELQPGFRYRRQFAGVACAPALAEALGVRCGGRGCRRRGRRRTRRRAPSSP